MSVNVKKSDTQKDWRVPVEFVYLCKREREREREKWAIDNQRPLDRKKLSQEKSIERPSIIISEDLGT